MYKALIADDESFILDGLRAIIPWTDYNVEIGPEALNGDEASRILAKDDIDIFISDIRMPGKSGLEVIREIRDRGDRTRVIVLSGYDDFDYVREAAVLGIDNYLLKPIDREELAESVARAVQRLERESESLRLGDQGIHRLRGNLFFRLVTGKLSASRFVEQWPVFASTSTVSLIQVALLDQPQHRTKQVFRTVMETPGLAEHDYLLVNIDETIVLLLTEQKHAERMTRRVESIHRNLTAAGLRVRVALGSVQDGVDGIVASYWDALKVLRSSDEAGLTLFRDSVEEDPAGATVESTGAKNTADIDRYHQIRGLIQQGDFKELLRFVEKSLSNPYARPKDQEHAALEIVFSILHGLRRVVPRHRQHLLPEDARIVARIVPAPSLQETRAVCTELVALAEELTPQQSRKQVSHHLVRRAMHEVMSDLSQPMNLKSVSAELGVNANYLGQLVRSELGRSFTEYLTDLRIAEAKTLLCETTEQVQTIARRVGFTDTSYFTRVFRSVTGVSPSEYRRRGGD